MLAAFSVFRSTTPPSTFAVRQTDFRCDRCFARSEAELRQTTVQWHLATLETATYATARTRVLTFVTTTTGFAEARTDTTTRRLPAF